MMEGRLIHWCAIETGEATTGAADAYGQYATVVTTESTRCLFKNGGTPKMLESGAFVADVPTVALPATTAVVEGQTIVGVSAGWARTYVVRAVRTVWNRMRVDHIACDLEAV
jgi:hypothetical protein